MTFYPTLSLITLGMLLTVPASVPAQSLGEFARQYRKEMQARKQKGEVPARVFTNNDIARMPPAGALGSSSPPPSGLHAKPPAPSQPPGTTGGEIPSSSSARQAGKAAKTKKYWQARFRATRNALEHAEEELNVVQNELELLQIQQARELDPDRSRKLNSRIDTTTVEIEDRRAEATKARQALEKLEREFKESGAPHDWVTGKSDAEKADAESSNPSTPGAGLPPRR